MSKYKDEILNQWEVLDAQCARTENPFHRLIIKNFKIHVLLEATGRAEELLSPKWMVDRPVYRMHEGHETVVLDGKEDVAGFYLGMKERGEIVMWLTDYHIEVSDWGFSSEVVLKQFISGSGLTEAQRGLVADYDPTRTYLLSRGMSFHFPSDPDGRIAGEHVYSNPTATTVELLAPEDVITTEEIAELLTPQLEAELAS